MTVETQRYNFKCGLLAVLFLFISIGLDQDAPAADPEPPNSPTTLDYALFLYDQGDISRAAGEARRFLYFHPQHPQAFQARDLLNRIQNETADRPGILTGGPPAKGMEGADDGGTTGLWGNVAIGLIHFYQEHLRTFKNPQSVCPSYPECSVYTIQAVKKHGALLGTFMFIDRLWRETGTAGKPPFVRHQGRILHYDPLEWNDYWLNDHKERP